MVLEVTIGESICIRMDDGIEDSRPVPEQVEDYLTRMSRAAVKTYTDIPTSSMIGGDDDEG
jgi:hypothetical protein